MIIVPIVFTEAVQVKSLSHGYTGTASAGNQTYNLGDTNTAPKTLLVPL